MVEKSLHVADVSIGPIQDQATSADQINAALRGTVNSLRSNARLDREELDLLWWILADWSSSLGAHFSRRRDITGLLAGGLEASNHLNHLPAEAHYQLILRHVESDVTLTLAQLLDEVGDLRQRVTHSLDTATSTLTQNAHLFPLSATLVTGQVQTLSGADIPRTQEQWRRPALLEGALLHI